jgi:hypothetical protein
MTNRTEAEARMGLENLTRLRQLIAETRSPWAQPSMQRLVKRLALSLERTGQLPPHPSRTWVRA